MRADLHVHSRHSPDGYQDARTIARRAKACGLFAVALTDHNSVAGHAEMREACKEAGLLFVPGVEVSSSKGHIAALGVTSAPHTHRSPADTIEEIHSLGGLASAAHPGRIYTGLSPENVRSARFDAVEAFNAHSAVRHNVMARNLTSELSLPVTAGSDAHYEERVGMGYVQLGEPAETLDALLEALRKGEATAAGNPRNPVQVFGRAFINTVHWVLRGGRGI